MKIFFATCDEKKTGTADDQILRDELVRRGYEIEFKAWTDAQVQWCEADCILIRSTWDYHRQLPDFMKWAKRVEDVSRLHNPIELLRWNYSKHYLLKLAAQGLPIIPSNFVGDVNSALFAIQQSLQVTGEVVIKPAISATAELTYRLKTVDESRQAIENILQRGDLLVQPFISSISEMGEVSLIFFEDCGVSRFSHAVQKLPRKGDFRVQSDFGGSVSQVDLSHEIIELGDRILKALPVRPLYARVDLVNWKTQPLIGEVELIEPELYFRCSHESSSLFANALTAACGKNWIGKDRQS